MDLKQNWFIFLIFFPKRYTSAKLILDKIDFQMNSDFQPLIII